jgi:hypothetical protein
MLNPPSVKNQHPFCFVLFLLLFRPFLLDAAEPFDCSPGLSSTAIDFTRFGGSQGLGFQCTISDQAKESCPEGRQPFQVARAIDNGLVDSGPFFETPVSSSDGFLLNPQQLAANGLVSSVAKMEFEFGTSGEEPATVSVLLNGSNVANLPLRFGPFRRLCVDIPIGSLKFGHRTANGSLQVGRNTLVFRLSRNNTGAPPQGEGPFTFARATQLRFQALSPIMLLHGIRDNGSAFSQLPGAPPNLAPFVQLLSQRSFGFEVIRYNPITIEDGRSLVPGAINRALGLYGSGEAHLVAWSKGGLWVRAAIEANRQDARYRTLFSIDTPHNGALGGVADSLAEKQQYVLQIGNALGLNAFLAQAKDLAPAVVKSKTASWAKTPHIFSGEAGPTKSQYFSIAANADANVDGIIQASEANGFMGGVYDDPIFRQGLRLLNYLAGGFQCGLRVDISGNDLWSRVVNAFPIQCGRTEPNDLVVKVSSARSPAFIPLGPNSPTEFNFYYNHSTVLNSSVTNTIIAKILLNEPMAK